jgi:isopropylmalate/homocitrate/citramalate synthase
MLSFETTSHPWVPALTLVDTTLREGEQFRRAYFTSEQRLVLARLLDAFGMDVIELPSPRLSPQTEADVRAIARLGLRARIAAHVHCADEDVEAALAAGADAVHLFYGASPHLRAHSHGRGLEQIAASFARIFYRNAINIGLPVLVCPEAAAALGEGDEVTIDTGAGTIIACADGTVFHAEPLPEFVQRIVAAGGIVALVREQGRLRP